LFKKGMNLLSNFGAVMNKSLSPLPDKLQITILLFGSDCAHLIVSATAWADSIAGKIHSVFIKILIADSASSSDIFVIFTREIFSKYDN
jgi:hypothetical protein